MSFNISLVSISNGGVSFEILTLPEGSQPIKSIVADMGMHIYNHNPITGTSLELSQDFEFNDLGQYDIEWENAGAIYPTITSLDEQQVFYGGQNVWQRHYEFSLWVQCEQEAPGILPESSNTLTGSFDVRTTTVLPLMSVAYFFSSPHGIKFTGQVAKSDLTDYYNGGFYWGESGGPHHSQSSPLYVDDLGNGNYKSKYEVGPLSPGDYDVQGVCTTIIPTTGVYYYGNSLLTDLSIESYNPPPYTTYPTDPIVRLTAIRRYANKNTGVYRTTGYLGGLANLPDLSFSTTKNPSK